MSAQAAIIELLFGYAPLTALVGDRIYPGELPQGTVLPAVVVSHISTTPLTTIDAQAPFSLVRSRVETTIIAKDYPGQQTVVAKVRGAANFKRGTLGGVTVVSILRDLIGPDMRDTDTMLFSQNIDFAVTWQEPNP